jgi:hypothetical protein
MADACWEFLIFAGTDVVCASAFPWHGSPVRAGSEQPGTQRSYVPRLAHA